jgi:WD40 repeat protein
VVAALVSVGVLQALRQWDLDRHSEELNKRDVAQNLLERELDQKTRKLEQNERKLEQNASLQKITLAAKWLNLHRHDEARRYLDDCPVKHREIEWHLLHGQCRLLRSIPVVVLELGLKAATLDPNGKRLAIVEPDGGKGWAVNLIDLATGEQLATSPLLSSPVAAITFAPEGRHLAIKNRPLRPDDQGGWLFWETCPGGQLSKSPPENVVFLPFGKDPSSGSQLLSRWSGGKAIPPPLKEPVGWYSPDGRYAFRLDFPRGYNLKEQVSTLRVWETATGQELPPLKGAFGGAADVFSPCGRYLAAIDNKFVTTKSELTPCKVHVRELATGRTRHVLVPVNDIQRMAVSPDGKFLAVGAKGDGARHLVRVFAVDDHDGQEVFAMGAFGGLPYHVEFTPDGTQLVSVDSFAAHVWDVRLERGRRSAPVVPDDAAVVAVPEAHRGVFARSTNGRLIAALQPEGNVALLDANTGKQLRTFVAAKAGTILGLAFSRDAQRLVAVGREPPEEAHESGLMVLWEVESGLECWRRKTPGLFAHVAAFSPNGNRLIVGKWKQTNRSFGAGDHAELAFLEPKTGTELLVLQAPQQGFVAMIVSPDGHSMTTLEQGIGAGPRGLPTGRGETAMIQWGETAVTVPGYRKRAQDPQPRKEKVRD